ncbi:TonB-dependent receptor P3 [Neolewinella maritima]|uniref:TonB-dependent receptor P3 n=1 Tax=Neolewinella maritima TaxID=1383882 RepID=A0ABM9B3P7_9BACT|nr:TonB-dependent receptor [Neolewinella maritima]CAH1001846.1 TonB-dependent receptor P3 [Neolewinella maritima]
MYNTYSTVRRLWATPLLTCVLLLASSLTAVAIGPAVLDVSGRVTDTGGEPLIGVTVRVKSTTAGTVTDLDGLYALSVDATDTLLFSYTGFATQEVAVSGRSSIDVVLEADAATLDEVVVVGYGTVKKSDLTGAVSSVKSEEITAYPTASAEQALQGRAAGVQITANNGAPGAGFRVRVRGGTSINASSDPIFVVDGFVGASLPPPEDIASIEVLKDASATAIYGSRGANGVIMVTTKRGQAGQTRIELNSSYTLQNEINRLELLNADQFAAYQSEINPDFEQGDSDTDWQDLIFRRGAVQNYQLGISGGSDNVRYYLSGTYFQQEGVIVNSDYERFSVTSNIDITASERLNVGLNLLAKRENTNSVATQETGSVIGVAYRFEPDVGIRDAQGRYTLARISDRFNNAVALTNEPRDQDNVDQFRGSIYGNYQLLPGLDLRSTFNASTNNGRNGFFSPRTLNPDAGINGSGRVRNSRNMSLLTETYLTYTRDFSASNLTLLAGYSYQRETSEFFVVGNRNFVTDAGYFFNLGGGSEPTIPNSGRSESDISSYIGRINYSLNDRYLFTLTGRYDGTSVFSEGNKWAIFPSGAVAWNMAREPFMEDSGLFSNFKWRVSYGLTGNRAIGPYSTLARFDDVFTVQNGTIVNAVAPTAVANNDLTWETTSQLDIGVDIGILEGRINLTADYYSMETYDLLFALPLPEYSGYSTLLSNIGRVGNKGVELSIDTRNLVGAFRWNTNLNISTNKNEILELPEGNDIFYNSGPGHIVGLGNTQVLRVGEPVGVFFGFQYDGVYQQGDDIIPGGSFDTEPGGERYADISGDGMLNSDDRIIIGNPHPDFIFGITNEFAYRNFDLNLFLQGSQGNDIYSYTLLELDLLAGLNNATTAALDRWTPSNTNTNVPAAQGGRSRRSSSRFVYDGSYVRLKNVALGYSLPAVVLDRFGLSRLRVYLSAQNLLTFTDYEGYDPEVGYRSGGGSSGNQNVGLDYASYPNVKGFTVGVNVGF